MRVRRVDEALVLTIMELYSISSLNLQQEHAQHKNESKNFDEELSEEKAVKDPHNSSYAIYPC